MKPKRKINKKLIFIGGAAITLTAAGFLGFKYINTQKIVVKKLDTYYLNKLSLLRNQKTKS